MPRFYFDMVENGVATAADNTGLEIADLDTAEFETAVVLANMMADAESLTISVVIRDATKLPVARVKLCMERSAKAAR
jgi:hypothetical protein